LSQKNEISTLLWGGCRYSAPNTPVLILIRVISSIAEFPD